MNFSTSIPNRDIELAPLTKEFTNPNTPSTIGQYFADGRALYIDSHGSLIQVQFLSWRRPRKNDTGVILVGCEAQITATTEDIVSEFGGVAIADATGVTLRLVVEQGPPRGLALAGVDFLDADGEVLTCDGGHVDFAPPLPVLVEKVPEPASV